MINRYDVRRQLISVLSFEILIEFNIGNQVHGKFIFSKSKKIHSSLHLGWGDED